VNLFYPLRYEGIWENDTHREEVGVISVFKLLGVQFERNRTTHSKDMSVCLSPVVPDALVSLLGGRKQWGKNFQ
jgi:hypothetical protein